MSPPGLFLEDLAISHEVPNQDTAANLPTDRRALLAAGALLAGKANAGPLTPPRGPIAPTPGPEPRTAINAANIPGDADSLFRVSQPGSYYLTGNIIGVAAKHGIEIAASGNFIIKNACSDNTTNWDVVAANILFVFSATAAAAVTGNFGGASPGSTNPFANFTY